MSTDLTLADVVDLAVEYEADAIPGCPQGDALARAVLTLAAQQEAQRRIKDGLIRARLRREIEDAQSWLDDIEARA